MIHLDITDLLIASVLSLLHRLILALMNKHVQKEYEHTVYGLLLQEFTYLLLSVKAFRASRVLGLILQVKSC